MKFTSTLKSVATAALMSAAVAGQSLSASAGATYYVKPEADGTGTGVSWESPWTLANAFSKVANGDVLLVKAGTYDYKSALTISKVITVRGGLKGTDDTTLAGSNSVFHAAATALFITLSSDTSASDTNVFERCTFSGASEKGRAALYKTGKTSIRLESCRFCDNGSNQKLVNNNRYLSGYGIGLHVEGSADAVAVVTNCVFDGNNSNCQMGTDGCALYARNLGRLIVEDCLFLTNGVSWAAQVTIGNHGNVGQKGGLNGSAICVDGVPVTVRGCRFIANVSTWLSGACGGCVRLNGASGGSVFDRCLWVGNVCTFGYILKANYASQPGTCTCGSALAVNLSEASASVDVNRCTFAFNQANSTASATGITVAGGTLNLSNSIVASNIAASYCEVGADLTLRPGGFANVSNSFFSARSAVADVSEAGTNLVVDLGSVHYGDPCFVTPYTNATAKIISANGYWLTYPFYDVQYIDEIRNFDAHVTSPAGYWRRPTFDAEPVRVEDPTAPFSASLLAGYYAGTSEAADIPSGGQPKIGAINVSFPDPASTRPEVVVALMSDDPSTAYLADFTANFKVGEAVVGSVGASGVTNGETVVVSPGLELPPGATVRLEVVVTAPGATEVRDDTVTVAVPGSQPEIGEIRTEFVNGQTRPKVSVTLSGATPETKYSAAVTVCLVTNGVTFATETFGGVTNGQTVVFSPCLYLDAGDRMDVTVSVTSDGSAVVSGGADDIPVTGRKPIWDGKGGGPGVIHVRGGADGLATGENWTHALTSIASALALVTDERCEIWIAGAVTNADGDVVSITPTAPRFVVRGGFTGAENAASERPAGGRAVVDGGTVCNCLVVANDASTTVVVERVSFENGANGNFRKTGKGDVELLDCRIACGNWVNANANQFLYGIGAYVNGGGDARAVVSNCVFEGNGTHTEKGRAGGGMGLSLESVSNAVIDSCLFVTNGVTWDMSVAKSFNSYGATALYVCDTRAAVRNCRFVGNRGPFSSQGGYDRGKNSPAVNVAGMSAGTSFENCLWMANLASFCGFMNDYDNGASGALDVQLSENDDEISLDRCTIAYNAYGATASAGGLTVNKGTVRVRNSILYGNSRGSGGTCGKDIAVAAAGSVDIAYSLVEADTNVTGSAASITAVSNECLRIDRKTTVFGDPLFVTDLATMRPLVGNAAKIAEALACNLHVRGGTGYRDEVTKEVVQTYVKRKRSDSPAIDAGDPASDCRKETKPCGCRVNLGFYGNTPWATMSKGGTMIFVR